MENINMDFTGMDFLSIEDSGELYERISEIQRKFLAEGFCKIPDIESLSIKMEELIYDSGYRDLEIYYICLEASKILGMK
jgi:hypothetical protein